jgi:hypothetical protein
MRYYRLAKVYIFHGKVRVCTVLNLYHNFEVAIYFVDKFDAGLVSEVSVLTVAEHALALVAFLHLLAQCLLPPQKRQRLLATWQLCSSVVSLLSLLVRSSDIFLD